MKHLTKLTPAEVLMVIKDKKVTLDELLDITYKDLVIKNVLKSTEIKKPGHRAGSFFIYKYIERGEQFGSYQPMKHEDVFIKAVEHETEAKIMYRRLLTVTYKFSKSKEKYKHALAQSPSIAACFKIGFINKIFKSYSFTPQRDVLKQEIEQEIKQLESEMPDLIAENLSRASGIVNQIKGCVYLLSNLSKDQKKLLGLES